MIHITASDKSLLAQKAHSYVLFLQEGFSASKDLKEVAQILPDLSLILKKREFTGKSGQVYATSFSIHGEIRLLVLAGLGKAAPKKKIDIEQFRRSLARAIKESIRHKSSTVAVALPESELFGVDVAYLAEQTACIAYMGSYHFNEFLTDDSRKEEDLQELIVCVISKDKKAVAQGLEVGNCIGSGVNRARHWIDSPPSVLTPTVLANHAKELAKEAGLKLQIFDEKQVIAMGMGGLHGVSRGSDEECRFVVLEYHTKRKNAPTIAFVGKGITFDSGGLSIKPADYMEDMKEDMSGAAAVICALHILAHLKPDVNVIGIAPMSENLPSGKALKPGDVLRFYNGKTAEVRNTDAEGRLILADALSYAVKHYKPSAIIDVATLTGACAYALGHFYTGMMSQHDDLVAQVQASADRSGDRVWRLPMHDDYKPAIRSEVADISNTGSRKYMAGTVTAAHFLQHFVDDVPWVHLDIAGSAYNVPDIPYFRPGATGAGVRLLVDLAINWKD